MQRTFEQLSTELNSLYGPVADGVYKCYTSADPLAKGNTAEYWENVRLFLDELHRVLFLRDHTHCVEKLCTENYYFLTKLCVDRSFSLPDLITVRNDRKKQHCKILANDISHNVLPLYILYLKQDNGRKHTVTDCTPGPVRAPPGLTPYCYGPYMPPGMQMPGLMPQYMPMPQGMPMPYYMPMPMPGPMSCYMPMPMPMPPGMPQYRPASMPSAPNSIPSKPPRILPKPRCIKKDTPPPAMHLKLSEDDEEILPITSYTMFNPIVTDAPIPKILPVLPAPAVPAGSNAKVDN